MKSSDWIKILLLLFLLFLLLFLFFSLFFYYFFSSFFTFRLPMSKTPAAPTTSVQQERLQRNIVCPTTPSRRNSHTTAKNTVLIRPMTVQNARFSTETNENPMTGRRKIRPAVRIIKPSTRRNTVNSISCKWRQKRRKRSGRKLLRDPVQELSPRVMVDTQLRGSVTRSSSDLLRVSAWLGSTMCILQLYETDRDRLLELNDFGLPDNL